MSGRAADLGCNNGLGATLTTKFVRRLFCSSRTTVTQTDPASQLTMTCALTSMTFAGLVGAATAVAAAAILAPVLPTGWTGAAFVVTLAGVTDLVIYWAVLRLLGVGEARKATL